MWCALVVSTGIGLGLIGCAAVGEPTPDPKAVTAAPVPDAPEAVPPVVPEAQDPERERVEAMFTTVVEDAGYEAGTVISGGPDSNGNEALADSTTAPVVGIFASCVGTGGELTVIVEQEEPVTMQCDTALVAGPLLEDIAVEDGTLDVTLRDIPEGATWMVGSAVPAA